MAEDFIFEMRHITKSFPGVVALNDVSFNVMRGDIHGLMGENGAGKSTLVKILSGMYPAGTYTGEIVLNNKPIQLRSPHDALLQGIGIVPQEITVIDTLSVAENLVVGHWHPDGRFVINMRDIRKRAAELLDTYHIQLDPGKAVYRLSAAEKQLVMIARALYINPHILILDEPTSSLSLTEISIVFDIVQNLCKNHDITCIFITHKLVEIYEIADKVTVLRDGEVAGTFDRRDFGLALPDRHAKDGPLAEPDNDQGFTQTIITAMVGRKIDSLYPTRTTSAQSQEILRVENLTIPHPSISDKNVVEGVNFSLYRGEILGIAGLVGAGRSEVVSAIYGRLKHSGQVFVEGKPVHIANPNDAKRHGIALVTEERKLDGLLFNMAIRQNITVNSLGLIERLFMVDNRKERRYASDYANKLDVRATSIDTMVVNLSGGNQQKVILARVLLAGPKVLILDEPTKGVDIGAKHEIYKIMIDLVDNGLSIIMISSELPELLALCDRFVVLAGGKVRDTFGKNEASEHRVMLAATGSDSATS